MVFMLETMKPAWRPSFLVPLAVIVMFLNDVLFRSRFWAVFRWNIGCWGWWRFLKVVWWRVIVFRLRRVREGPE